ncbi:MAG: hypothetical protein R3F11_18035 [Verrucomicrobiales bacterium]
MPPWLEAADGGGFTLVLIDPFANPDHGDPLSWRSSAAPGGTPGGSDSIALAAFLADAGIADPNANDDGDRLPAWAEYAVGTDPNAPSVVPSSAAVEEFDPGTGPESWLTFRIQKRIGADDAAIGAQWSGELLDWSGLMEFVAEENNGDGTAWLIFRSTGPVGSEAFARGVIRMAP